MPACSFFALTQRKNQRKVKAAPKRLKFIAFSYSEKGYYQLLLFFQRRLESTFVHH